MFTDLSAFDYVYLQNRKIYLRGKQEEKKDR